MKWNEKVFGNVTFQRNQLLIGLNELDALAKVRHLSNDKLLKKKIVADLERAALLKEINWRQILLSFKGHIPPNPLKLFLVN